MYKVIEIDKSETNFCYQCASELLSLTHQKKKKKQQQPSHNGVLEENLQNRLNGSEAFDAVTLTL